MIENTTITVQGAKHDTLHKLVHMDGPGVDAGRIADRNVSCTGCQAGASGAPQTDQAPRMVTRGANRETLNIGWLRGSLPCANMDSAMELLRAFYGDPEYQDKGAFFRNHRFKWEGSVILAFDRAGEDGADDLIVIDIPATPIESLSVSERGLLLTGLKALGFSASRVDVSWDDFAKRILPEQVYDIAMKGHIAYVQFCELISSGRVGGPRATTCYLGKRGQNGGGKCVRIYRKDLESEGEIDAIRWEVEYSQDRAEKAFNALAATRDDQELALMIGKLVGGSCDFRDKDYATFKSSGGHLKDAPQYEWWVSILNELGSLKLAPERIESTIGSAMAAFTYQWKKTLANIREFKRELKQKDFMYWLQSVIEEGREQLGKKHKRKREIEHKRLRYLEELAAQCYAEEEEKRAQDEITHYGVATMDVNSVGLVGG